MPGHGHGVDHHQTRWAALAHWAAVYVCMGACSVDMVLVGAEAVVENGGIINKLGTYQIALVAKAHNKPMYVAAESYKFARLYPLSQRDLPKETKPLDLGPLLPPRCQVRPASARLFKSLAGSGRALVQSPAV